MPRGIPGSGPYSRVNADGSPKEKDDTATTQKSGPTKTTRPKKTTAKRTRRTNGNGSQNGSGNGVTDLGSFHTVTVGSDGTLTLEGGMVVRAKLRPSALLDLEADSKAAASAFLANR